MKTPKNLDQFVNLIQGMSHRERFVFEANQKLKEKYNEVFLYIEIYNTVLFEIEGQPRNITVHLVGLDGKPISKKSKMYKLWNDVFYRTVYTMFDHSEILQLN